jgi:transposase
MSLTATSLPEDLAAAHAMILAERAARTAAETRVRSIEAEIAGARLEIERLKLLLAKARRAQYGQSSERGARLVEQLELQLAEFEETVAEEDAATELAASPVQPKARAHPGRKPARRPLPEHLPRERIVYPAPCTCPKCGGPVHKLGEDITETLEGTVMAWTGRVPGEVRKGREDNSCGDHAHDQQHPA